MRLSENLPFLGFCNTKDFRKYLQDRGYWTLEEDLPNKILIKGRVVYNFLSILERQLSSKGWIIHSPVKPDELPLGTIIEGHHKNGGGRHHYFLKTKEGWLWDASHSYNAFGTQGEGGVWGLDYTIHNGIHHIDCHGNVRDEDVDYDGDTQNIVHVGGYSKGAINYIDYYRVLGNILQNIPTLNWPQYGPLGDFL